MPDHGEQESLLQAKGGERSAFDRLQRMLQDTVRLFVCRLIGPSDRQEEIVQDAFLALYLNLERIVSVEHLRPFLFRIVRNLCYDELRRQKRFTFVSLDEQGGGQDVSLAHAAAHRLPPDDQVHWILLRSAVQQAMERLPEPQRQALILHGEQGLSYEQVAAAMATDVGTVKSRIHYGRRNLLKRLKPDVRRALGVDKEKDNGGNK